MQLRGDALRVHLRHSLECLVELSSQESKVYVYSQKGFSVFAKVSRETIRQHQAFLDDLLSSMLISKRQLNVRARSEILEKKLVRMQSQLSEAVSRYEGLRAMHLHIFRSLIKKSVDVSILVGEVSAFSPLERCPCCGSFLSNQPPRVTEY